MWFISLVPSMNNFCIGDHDVEGGGLEAEGQRGPLQNNFEVYISCGSSVLSWGCIILCIGDNDVDVERRGLGGRGAEGGVPEEIMPSYTEQLLTSHNLPYQV